MEILILIRIHSKVIFKEYCKEGKEMQKRISTLFWSHRAFIISSI